MHYCILVFLEDGKTALQDLEGAVSRVMEPYGNGIEWDWFQIGGRWTGKFDGYDPEKDPKNKKVCTYCKGTGKRTDMEVKDGCNACGGTGKETLWPTQWKLRKGDTKPVKKLVQKDIDVYAMCCEGWGWMGGQDFVPWAEDPKSKFRPRENPPLAWLQENYPKGVAVIVDCHN